MTNPWLIWQLVDSAFPTGGFAHSAGLEAAWQHGALPDEPALRAFLAQSLHQAGRTALPFVAAAHRAPDDLPTLDRLCDTFLSNHVARRASTKQGQAFLATATAAFHTPTLQALRSRLRDDRLPGHLAPVFGSAARALGLPLDDARRLFLFIALRGAASAAVRLGVVGTLAAQRLQHELTHPDTGVAERIAQDSARFTLDDLAQPAPFLDILQATQDRLYSRLFQS